MSAQTMDYNQFAVDAAKAALAAANAPAQLPPQPNKDGEFPTPLEGALFMALNYGIPQTPLKGKIAFLPQWQLSASADPQIIQSWFDSYKCNFGSMSVLGSHFAFESDLPADGTPKIRDRYRFKSQSGDFTSHLVIESSPGKGHRYYASAPGVDNIAQGVTKYADFSVRAKAQYCVSPGSVHPVTQKQYRVVMHNGPLAPPTEQEIAFWKSEVITEVKSETQPVMLPQQPEASAERKSDLTLAQIYGVKVDGPGIPFHSHDNALHSIGCSLRETGDPAGSGGWDYPEIEERLIQIADQRCESRGEDYVQMAKKCAKQACKHEKGIPWSETVSMSTEATKQTNAASNVQVDDLKWLDLNPVYVRPIFPEFIMRGTSLYEGLAKPVSDVNSKYPELIWLPAVQLMLNYMHNKVGIKGLNSNVNIFLGLISDPGQFFKSSSCRLSHDYFQQMGLLVQGGAGLRNCDGKIVTAQAGSSEGFGKLMYAAKAKHGIMFNDELGKIVSKGGIDYASMLHDLLSWYESNDFSNNTSNPKNQFAFNAGTYCFGWQFCTTTRGFNSQWPKLAGIASGMPDRTFFLLTPKEPKPLTDEIYVNTVEGSLKTRNLILKALNGYSESVDGHTAGRHEYEIDSFIRTDLLKKASSFGEVRAMNMVYKFALYFAIDLDKEVIDEDCVERALALVDYRQKAIEFLEPIEAKNEEGRLLMEILREIRQNGGKMGKRDLLRNLHYNLYGDRFWKMVYQGAINADHFREFNEPGGHGQKKTMVGLVKEEYQKGM